MKDIIRRVVSKTFHLFYERKAKNKALRGKVLMFHSVGGTEDEFNISTEHFEKILKQLAASKIIRLESWERYDDFYCLSFDDVPVSFYNNAYPLLKKYRMPFTIFVSCSLLDTEGYITTNMLKELAACDLCTVGSHGWKHDFFYKFSEKEAREDLHRSKEKLESIINKSVELYAFPYGSYYACGLKHKHLVNEFYKYGFGTVACPITKPSSLPNYFLPRINLTQKIVDKIYG